MKVIEHINSAKDPLFSYEIVPPPRGRSYKDIVEIVEILAPLNPPWIDVTSHSSTAYFQEKTDGSIQKRTLKKRPGTLGICGIIQNRFKIDTVAHVLCLGFSREETEDALIELSYLGIENVLALRGDTPNFQKQIRNDRTTNNFAADLVTQIKDLSKGKFLDDLEDAHPLDFGVGVAGYPEKHFEAPNLKLDIANLKKKVDAGADYIVTQMFFDNQKYFDFVSECRAAGITVPIVPGLKILKSAPQLKSVPKNFYIDLPDALVDEVHTSPQHAAEIGKRWAHKQVQGLLEAGAPGVHFYVLNDVQCIADIVKSFK
ncbi:methylenetetrahydrofolate reductase [Bdellovibrio sp. NC01]|uniref:methylenetetrahydrofolate reductase n=1 Tax=Bdellovibrio sp. NC01 TaxID=2220073 RepID=UPI001159D1DC|nr:methylenetetrahydrofolate reductase [Bdellovibrio sp. NC01]QDK37522.1 methylenetetrahydrofolate reductase [NAD(P)H] [Bdellovibrio sp. NC01]